jgi:hypothetical protein
MRYADIEAMLSKALAILAQHDAALPKIRVALALECTKLSNWAKPTITRRSLYCSFADFLAFSILSC